MASHPASYKNIYGYRFTVSCESAFIKTAGDNELILGEGMDAGEYEIGMIYR